MKKLNTKTLVTLGLLVAIEVVLSRFLSINAWNIRIGFGFVPLAVCAYLYGPIPTATVAAVADIIGAIAFPTGPYFPGFTVTAVLTGLVFGFFLHKNNNTVKTLICVAINQLVIGLIINTFNISFLYGSPYLPLMATRLIQCAILLPVQFVVIRGMKPLIIQMNKIITNEA